jgi:crossover junction endodeoxyribonuclease RusA
MWPNSRVDRRASAGTRRKYREAGAWACKAAGFRGVDWQRAHLLITFCPPDRRKRDLDNMLAAIKSGLDGVSDVLGVDDSVWDLTIRRGCVVKAGEVQIEFGPPVDNTFVQYRGKVE